MKLYISYSGCWSGKLLEGENSKEWFNKNRKVIKNGSKDHPVVPSATPVSIETVLGIVYRLVGEQRRLWRVMQLGEYLDIFGKISFDNTVDYISRESIALREIGGAPNPCGWVGISKSESNVYFTNPDIYNVLCYPLVCTPKDLYNLIVHNVFGKANLNISKRMDVLNIIQNIDKDSINELCEHKRKEMLDKLKSLFCDIEYQNSDEKNYKVFCLSAMYLCADLLDKRGYKQTGVKWNKGISHRNRTPKDFFAAVSSGHNTVINFPMDDNWRKKTEKIQKPTGYIEINIDVDADRAIEIKELIESANVGCFSVGKKGLAYLDGIRI